MTKVTTAIFTALVIVLGVFFATHHAVYSASCTQTDQGCAHKLIKWEGNK